MLVMRSFGFEILVPSISALQVQVHMHFVFLEESDHTFLHSYLQLRSELFSGIQCMCSPMLSFCSLQ